MENKKVLDENNNEIERCGTCGLSKSEHGFQFLHKFWVNNDSEVKLIELELDLDEIDQELYEDTKIELSKQLFENKLKQDELIFLFNETIHEIIDLDKRNISVINCMTRLRSRLSLQITEMPYKEFSQYLSSGKMKIISFCDDFIDGKVNYKELN